MWVMILRCVIATCLISPTCLAQIAEGWSNAVKGLSNILIDAEEGLYKELEARPSGWRLERPFVLTKKETVGTDTIEFHYEPKSTPDGKPAAFGFNAGACTPLCTFTSLAHT